MRFNFLLPFILLLGFISCDPKVNVDFELQDGTVSGRIYPLNNIGKAGVYQSVISLVAEAEVASDGTFIIEDVPPGNYLLRITTEGFGSYELAIIVEEGTALDVGEIQLIEYPWPILSVEPDDLQLGIDDAIALDFLEPMDHLSVVSAVEVYPVPQDFGVDFGYYDYYDYYDCYIHAYWDYNTQYLITMDTTARTLLGRQIEKQLEMIVQTEPFGISAFYATLSPEDFDGRISIYFNGWVTLEDFTEHLLIEPQTEVEIVRYASGSRYTRFELEPTYTWSPGTTNMSITAGVEEFGGAIMLQDSTVSFELEPFRVINTSPADGATDVSRYNDIYIYFNAAIDGNSVANALTFEPDFEFNYEIRNTAYSYYGTYIKIEPHSYLEALVEYHVSLDSSATDLWGHPFGSDFEFSFRTY